MSMLRIIIAEVRHRWLHTTLAVIAVAVAVGVAVGVRLKLADHEAETDALLASYRAEVEARGAELEDEMRKTTKGLGFNVYIYPRERTAVESTGLESTGGTMDQALAHRLAEYPLRHINHLLPVLEQRFHWPQAAAATGDAGYVWLRGQRDQVPISWRHPVKPIAQEIKPGTLHLGATLAEQMNVGEGDTVTLRGREYTVARVLPWANNRQDHTVKVPLADAQAMLDMPGRITAILALNCNCSSLDMLEEVRAEVQGIVPEARVQMELDKAAARAKARNTAKEQAEASLAEAEATQTRIADDLRGVAVLLVPAVGLAAAVWIALLAFGNVRDRRSEIGLLRAMGFRGGQVMAAFLGKAAMIAAAGGVFGIALGVGSGLALFDLPALAWLPAELTLILAATIVGCVAVSWWPAALAARQDPATVLAEE